jgi:hypothetical protein
MKKKIYCEWKKENCINKKAEGDDRYCAEHRKQVDESLSRMNAELNRRMAPIFNRLFR